LLIRLRKIDIRIISKQLEMTGSNASISAYSQLVGLDRWRQRRLAIVSRTTSDKHTLSVLRRVTFED
jgi:hypothetical protein